MLSLLFVILMIAVFGKMIGFAIRATWGTSTIIFDRTCITRVTFHCTSGFDDCRCYSTIEAL